MRITSCLVRRALLQQAILITLVDLVLSNVSNENSMRGFFSQQISSKFLNNNNNNNSLTTLSLPLSQSQPSTKSLAQPTLNESLDAGYEPTRIDEPINKSHVERIKNKGRIKVNARKGRNTNIINNDSLSDDNDSDVVESDQQQPVVSKEGVAQAKRAARNVERKMNVISGRLNQIQSRIAEDHQAISNSTPVYVEYSTPYNGDQDNIDSSSMREFGSNDKATDLPVSVSVSSPSSGIVNNIEPPTQSQTSDPNWMNGPLNDGDDQLDNSSNRLNNQNIIRNESNHSFKYSPPIIKSVIPGSSNSRQDLSPSSSENSNSNTIGNEVDSMSGGGGGDQLSNSEDNNSEHNNNNNDNDLQPLTKVHSPKQHHHHHHHQNHLSLTTKPTNSHTLTGSLSNDQNILGFESALIGGDQMTNKNLNTTRYSNQLNSATTSQQGLSLSLLGPEWKTNEGLGTYHHFLELNSKNHNNNNSNNLKDANNPEQQMLDSVNKNGGVAFKVAPSLRSSITNKNGGRFQNMTILNSESDLLNSFSNQQQQHHHQQPIKMIQSPSIATAPSTMSSTTTTTSTTTKRPEIYSKKQPNSVHTYTASNYGRGSKENAQRTVTVQPVILLDNYDKAQDGSSFSDAYLTPTYINRNDTTLANDYLNQPTSIRWPEFATAFTSSLPSTTTINGNEINHNNNNNHNSKNNYDANFPVSKMLTSAATNNNRYSSQDSGESDTVQAGHKLVDMDSMMSNNLGNDIKSNMRGIFNTAQSNLEEQISRPARTSSNRHINQQQQQQDYQGLNPSQLSAAEMYNSISRRQHVPDNNKNTFSTYSTKIPSPTSLDESVIGSSSNNSSDLKHRSSSNSEDMSLNSYPNVDSSSSPYTSNRNHDQMSPQNNAFNDNNFQASQSSYQNPSDGSSDYGDTQTSYSRSPYNNRGLPQSFSQNPLFSQSNGGTTSSNNIGGQQQQQQMDGANLYSLTNEVGGGGGATLDNTLAYGYQPVSGIGNQRNQEQSGDASDSNNNRASLISTSDYGAEQADQSASQDQRALYAAALAAAGARNQAASNYYQTSAANGQDFMQPAATTSNQNLIRQQQLSQLTAAILSRNPSWSSIDVNSLLQRYQQQQQQQRLLASAQLQLQLQQQQQQQQQQQAQQKQVSSYQSADSTGFLPGYSSTRDQVIYRRYSPDSGSVTSGSPYMSARSVQSGTESGQLAASGDLVPYSTGSQFQPVYSRTGGEANLAYYQAALAAAAAAAAAAASAKTNSPATQLQMDQQSSLMGVTSPYLSQQSTGQQQHYATALGGGSNNYSAGGSGGGGSLYATSAVNNPAFAVYTTDPVAASQHLKPISTAPASPTTSALGSTNQQVQQGTQQTTQQQQQQYSTAPYKKSYLNSLFKPTASSRYYYTPTILSPISYDPTPTSMHSLYAPASLASASEQMQAQITSLPQMYANPYLQHASGFTAADQAQQYQAYAAAAAAANGLHPQYMTDPDMAESSMVPTDTSNAFAEAASGQGTSSGSGSSSSDDNNNNNGNGNSNGSVSKSGKSMGPWSNIATLMLGILPLGILMSYLMPAVTIAGRKKRELELSGRNFSELLKWRPPSSVLNALMSGVGGVGQESGASKASTIISELISSIAPGKPSSSSVDNGQQQQRQQQQQYNKRRSLVERPSLTQRKSSWDKLIPQQQQHQTSPTFGVTMKSNHHLNDPSSPTTTSTATATATTITNTESTTDPTTHLDTKSTLDSTATTLNSPSSSTTPLPQQLLSQANNNSASGVKSKFKKAMNALNNFIVAASANMKRKHRSSMIENHWSIPSIIKSSLKLDNLFNVQELKRQLVEKAKEIQLAQQQQQQYSLLGKHQLAPVEQSSFSQRKSSSNSMFAAPSPMTATTTTTTTTTSSPTLAVTKSNQTQQAGQMINNSTIQQQVAPQQQAVTTDFTSEDVTASSQLEIPVTSSVVVPKVQYQFNQPEMSVVNHQDTTTYNPKLSVISSKSLFVSDQQTSNNKQQKPVVNLLNTDKAADVNNSTRNHLEVCLNQFLCRLTVKLSKSLKNTYITSAQTGASGDNNHRSPNSSTLITPDHVEKLTKKYINQLVEQIETENPSLKLNSKMYQNQEIHDSPDDEQQQHHRHHHHHWNNTRSENPLDVLYKNAMKNQCSIMYNCVELIQLEKTLSKMKLKLS